jgi:hypothetical protein
VRQRVSEQRSFNRFNRRRRSKQAICVLTIYISCVDLAAESTHNPHDFPHAGPLLSLEPLFVVINSAFRSHHPRKGANRFVALVVALEAVRESYHQTLPLAST